VRVKFGLTLREHRLGVFEKWVLRRIFGGLKRREAGASWIVVLSPNIIRMIKSRG
jgi:hypothetical protein